VVSGGRSKLFKKWKKENEKEYSWGLYQGSPPNGLKKIHKFSSRNNEKMK